MCPTLQYVRKLDKALPGFKAVRAFRKTFQALYSWKPYVSFSRHTETLQGVWYFVMWCRGGGGGGGGFLKK